MKLVIALLTLAIAGSGQEPAAKFRVRIGSQVKGTEEFSTVKSPEGYRQTGKSRLEVGGAAQELRQELVLSPDRNLVSYRLEVQYGDKTQVIEARRDGDKVVLQSKSVDFHSGLVVLDNIITAHYQLLLDSLPPKAETVDLEILVPQILAVVKGKLEKGEEEPATLDSQRILARKYKLVIAGLLTEIWAAAADNKLMRVSVPIQSVEMSRDGFALIPKAAAATPSACRERELKFPSGEFQVPGTLCLPLSALGRVPLVVLVHGSGAHDRDETIAGNKPFRDLAEGLAASGIATLRYDKRTFAFPGSFGPKATVEEEVIADAVAALAYGRTLPEVDPKQVFVLGHSLGGSMAPFIAERSPEIRGVILMAAAARPLDELTYEQVAFQSRSSGQDEASTAVEVGKLKQTFARIRSGEAPDSEKIMNAPAFYWRDLLKRDTIAALKRITQPVLVLQGGKDVQVLRTDYDLIVQALGGRAEAHFLPSLNHLFMTVEGRPTGAEYGLPGHVDPQVMQFISKWVKK